MVGIGEFGLDYFYDKAPRDAQQASFRQHIRAARLTGLPLAIHARSADDDIARILQEEWDAGGPYRSCCTASARAAGCWRRRWRLGGYVSFSGILTFPKSAELRDIARDVPEDRLLVETDAPYLAPVPHRGKRNEPAWVAQTAGVLAEVRGLAPEALAELTTRQLPPPVHPDGLAVLRVTILGCGGSAGVPQLGGADGRGDWGACDPAEPRNRRTRSSIVIEGPGGERLLVDASPDMRHAAAGLRRAADRRDPVHPCPCRPRAGHRRRPHPEPHRRPPAGRLRRPTGRWRSCTGGSTTRSSPGRRRISSARCWCRDWWSSADVIEAAGMAVQAVRAGPRLHADPGPAGRRVRLLDRRGRGWTTLPSRLWRVWTPGWWTASSARAHKTHANARPGAGLGRRLRPRRMVLTHMGYDVDWAWLSAHLPPGVEPAHDGLILEVPEHE